MTDQAVWPALARECRVFARYLAGMPPTRYVLERYAAAQASLPTAPHQAPRIDRLLLGVATPGVPLCRIADAYARWCRPRGLLRQKLVLALAVLENSPPAHRSLTAATTAPPLRILLGIAGSLALGLGALLAGLIAFGPIHLVLGGGNPRRSPPAHG